MRINHNIAALNTYRQLNSAAGAQSKSMEKLSSGLRINRAGDDAAGLAISEKMRGQIRGLEMGAKNAQDGISLIQTAEGALNETHDILQRMRELAVQSSNDTNTATDRGELQKEVDQLAEELSRIADTTEFNTQKLLDGTFNGKFQIGANADQNINLAVNSMDAQSLQVANLTWSGTASATETDTNNLVSAGGVDATGYTGPNGTVSFKLSSDFAATTTNTGSVTTDNTTNGPTITGQAYTQTGTLQVAYDETAGTGGTIEAGDFTITDSNAGQTWTVADNGDGTYTATNTTTAGNTFTFDAAAFNATAAEDFTITVASATAYNGSVEVTNTNGSKETVTLTNFNPNATDTVDTASGLSIDLEDALSSSNAGQSFSVAITGMTSSLGTGGIRIDTQADANSAITTINSAIETVSAERSKLGAYQNRLEHTINNLSTSSENLTAAESRIRDVDYALAA